jgi:hypothetical protein
VSFVVFGWVVCYWSDRSNIPGSITGALSVVIFCLRDIVVDGLKSEVTKSSFEIGMILLSKGMGVWKSDEDELSFSVYALVSRKHGRGEVKGKCRWGEICKPG